MRDSGRVREKKCERKRGGGGRNVERKNKRERGGEREREWDKAKRAEGVGGRAMEAQRGEA